MDQPDSGWWDMEFCVCPFSQMCSAQQGYSFFLKIILWYNQVNPVTYKLIPGKNDKCSICENVDTLEYFIFYIVCMCPLCGVIFQLDL